MPTYIQKNINSDLTPFPDLNKEMSVGSGIDTSIAISGINTSTSRTLGFITPSGVPNSNSWEDSGTWTVEIQTDIGNAQVDAQLRCVRLDTSGNILQSGILTATQSLQQSRIFTPAVPIWNDGEESLSNRLAIAIFLTSMQVMDQSVSIGVGTTDNEVITNITENMTAIQIEDSIDLFILPHQTTSFRDEDLIDTIYFVDDGTDKVHRVPIDIPDGETAATRDDAVGLVSGLTTPTDIALDLKSLNEKMYWSDGGTNKIQRSNLDGTDIEDIITSTSNPKGITLDLNDKKLYYVDTGAQKVHRSDLDGNNQEDLIGGLSSPQGITLDLPSGHMYFTTAGGTKVSRANLDGSDLTALVATDTSAAIGIVLDLVNRNMYWADSSQAIIKRAGMDIPEGQNPNNRTDVTNIITGLTNPNWVVFDPVVRKLYWTDTGTDKIQRSDLDGSNIEDILSTGLLTPLGLDLITSPDILDLFIQGLDSTSGSMTLIINGPQQETDQLNLFLEASPTESGALDLFIHGLDNINNNLDLIINGHLSISGDLDIVLQPKDQINNSLNLVLLAVDITNSGLNIFINGKITDNNNLDLFLNGHINISNGLDLVLLTKNTESGSITLFNPSCQVNINNLDLHVQGRDIIVSGLDLSITGHITNNNDLDLFLKTNILNNDIDLLIIGHEIISNNLNLLTIGHELIDSNIDLFIASKDNQDQGLSLTILGHDDIQSDIDLITEGHVPDDTEFTLFINGKDNISNTIDLVTLGHNKTTSTISIKIKRDSTITDSPFDDTKFGLAESLIVGHDGISNRMLLTFDIASIPSGSIIQRAEIHGTTLVNVSGLQEFRSHPVTKDWVEDQVTWNERSSGVAWDNSGSDFVSGIFDIWQINSVSGQLKTDIIATNVVQNAVTSGLSDVNILLKEKVEASITTEISSQQNPLGGPALIITFSIQQPNLDLFTQGHESIESDLDLNALGHIVESGTLDLITSGSGIIPFSGSLDLCINGVVAKTDDPTNPTCPPLDPIASIQISAELIGIYQSRIDALINQLGKNVFLEFKKTRVACPNCLFDTMRDRSRGIFRPGGPRPFARGRSCPWCKGKGFEETDNNKCIKALLKWNPRDAADYGLSLSDHKGIVRIKTFLTEYKDLVRAETAIVNHDIADIANFRVKLIRGPIPVGLREDRYCISFWELLDD